MATKRNRAARRARPSAVCVVEEHEPRRIVRLKTGKRPVAGSIGGVNVELQAGLTESVRTVTLGPQQVEPSLALERGGARPLVVKEPEPRLEIRVWGVYAHDDGTPEPIDADDARTRVGILVERANRDLQGTGIRLVYLPKHDFEFRDKSELRRDVALTDDEIDDFKNESISEADGQKLKDAGIVASAEARSKLAAEHDDRLLWLFTRGNRVNKLVNGSGAFTGWEYKDARMGSFSGLGHQYAALHDNFLSSDAVARDDASRAVHETGHFLDLPHTHREKPPLHNPAETLTAAEKTGTAAQRLDAWRAHAAAWFAAKHPNVTTAKAAREAWDNDRSAEVFDTPADPGDGIIALANEAAGNQDDELGPVESVSVDVASVSGPVVLKPDRANVMSYFLTETADPMHFSKDQIAHLRKVLIDGQRRRLVGAQLGDTASPDLTICAVWSPSKKGQRFTWNRDGDAHEAENDKNRKNGLVMAHQQAYTRKGEVRYDGIWNPGTQPQQFAWGWLDGDVHNDQAVRIADGMRPVRAQGYQHLKEGIRYNVIYEPGKGDSQVSLGRTQEQLESDWKTLKKKFRMTCLAAHTDKLGTARYSTVLRPGTFEQEWVAGLEIQDMVKEYDKRWKKDWRIRDITVVKTKDGPRWSALFEKESGGQVVWWGHVREWIAEVYSRMWAGNMRLRAFAVFPS